MRRMLACLLCVASPLSLMALLCLCIASPAWAGLGTEGDPFTIAEALALSLGPTQYWARGYIVGGRYDDFATPWDNDYGLSCADSASESDINNCLQVKLEADGGRATWGLNSHPENYQKLIKFRGFRDTYGGYASFEGITNSSISEVTGGSTNQPPTLGLSPAGTNKSVIASNLLQFAVSATEPTNDAADTISLWATGLPSGASFPTTNGLTPLTNSFAWTPTSSQTGVCTVTFLAGDKDGTNSTAVNITVTPCGDGVTTYRAVICGISDYEGTINDLDYCDDDAQDLYDRLRASGNWSTNNMKLLLDSQATETNIHAKIQLMAAAADSDDICLFFFSGHGGQMDDESPFDEADGYDEFMCPYNLNTQEIVDDELSDWLDELPTDRLIVWLDTCHSGGNLKSKGRTPKCVSWATNVVAKGDGFVDDLKLRRKDVNDLTSPYISTACDDDEYSYEDPSIQHGVYTYYLLEALDNADANVNGWVSGEESFDYLYPRVVAFESTQHPQEYDAYPGQAEVVGEGGGVPSPSVTITNPAAPSVTLDYTNTAISIQGVCNTSTVGQLSWTNSLTGSNGTVAAATSWSIANVFLAVGTNVIAVSGTNSAGEAASDSVSVRRRDETSGNLLLDEDFDESTSVPDGWVNGGTENDTSLSHVQSSPNCRALGAGDTLVTPAVNYPSQISFYADASSAGDGKTGTIDYAVGAGGWTLLGTFVVSDAGGTKVFDLTSSPDLTASANVKFRFNSSFYTWYLDDVLVLGVSITNQPVVTITNPVESVLTVSNATAFYTLQGTANSNVVGQMSWTNALTGGNGTIAAATNWTINSIALAVGANGITVRGTNGSGSSASDALTITRQAAGGGGAPAVIWFQGFEGTSTDTWTFSGAGINLAGAARTGANGRRLAGTQAITLDPVSISGYNGVTLTIHNASAGGIENADRLEVYVALNGGSFPATPDIWIGEGDTNDASYNKTWAYTATGVATTAAGTPARYHGDGAAGYATVLIAIPAGATSLSVQVAAQNNKTDEFYYVDDIALTGSGGEPDDDGDGMPNWWEEQYSGGATNLDAGGDNDEDGFSNLDEWISSCNPTSAASYFKTDDLDSSPGGGYYILRWASDSNRVYGVSWSTNLVNGFAELATNLPATPFQNVYTDTLHAAEQAGFYRIDVRMEP